MPASVAAQSVPSQSPESHVMVDGVVHLPFPLQT